MFQLFHVAPLALTIALMCASTGAHGQARCAYVDVNVQVGTAPVERCFDLHQRCRPGETLGCFKSQLQFKPRVIRQPGRPDMRETASDFGYIDRRNTHWDVPGGFVTDGASIPPAIQPLLGGSWDERYIRAAVLHDFYIRRLTADPESVHRLFFHALLASGTAYDRSWIMYRAVKRYGPQWTSIDLADYEKNRRENLARIEAENARARAEYESCLARHLDNLRAPPRQGQWANCPLDDRHQFILDLVNITRHEIGRSIDDYKRGKCRQTGKDKFDCSTPEPTAAELENQLGACNYQCGVSLCCVRATKTQCAARAHSVFIEGAADSCP